MVIDDWGAMNALYTFISRSIKTLDNSSLPMKLPDTADDWKHLL